jgi:branched-chain amino acid transport system substrate-binding protein
MALGALGVGSLAIAGRTVQAQAAKPAELKVGIATYLSGPASVFGVPGRQAAEMLFDEINAEGGIAGVKVRPIFVDEGPGVDHFVGEYRRLVQSENVNIVFSAISSADWHSLHAACRRTETADAPVGLRYPAHLRGRAL